MQRGSEAEQRQREVIEETEWLLAGGLHPERIAASLGYRNWEYLLRQLERWEQHNLCTKIKESMR